MKAFQFHNAHISIERTGYGQYRLTGLGRTVHCTDATVYDYCTYTGSKCRAVRRTAYNLLKNN